MIHINGQEVDGVLEGDRIAVRNFKGPYNRVTIDGKPRRVLRVSASQYVPGVAIVTLEK